MSRLAPWLRNWLGNRSGRFELNRLGQQELRMSLMTQASVPANCARWRESGLIRRTCLSAV